MTAPVLQGTDLQLRFGDVHALDGIDVSVFAGETLVIMGASGSGKSTLMHCLAGVLRCDGGQVYFAGERFDDKQDRQRSAIRLRHFGFVAQFGDLVPELTLLENIALPLLLTGVRHRQAMSRARKLVDELEIGTAADRRAGQTSGGQVQRAAIARALVHEPSVVFADEPTGALDSASSQLVLEALLRLTRSSNTAVVLVTHDATVASYADREIVLRDGRLAGKAMSQ